MEEEMLLILLIVITIVCLVVGEVKDNTGLTTTGIVLCVCSVILIIVWLCSYPTSLSSINDMENFYKRNQQIMADAVEKYPDAAVMKNSDGATTQTKLNYEYTQKVMDYNKGLNWYRKYQHNPVIAPFVGEVSEDLQFIKLENIPPVIPQK
jgi:hypothetical protein